MRKFWIGFLVIQTAILFGQYFFIYEQLQIFARLNVLKAEICRGAP